MTTRLGASRVPGTLLRRLHTGVGAGIAAVAPMMAVNMLWVGNSFPSLFGLDPFAVLWGVGSAGITSIDRVDRYAADPLTGPILGIGFSSTVWIGPITR